MDNKRQIEVQSVKFNFVMNVILKISQVIFPLIMLPYVTRVLGGEGNGKVAFVASVISYFSVFAQLGIPTYGIRICAQCRDNREKLSKTVQELLLINFISVGISYVALIFSFILIPKLQNEPLLLLIYSISILLNSLGMEWFYQAIEQYRYITVRNISFKIVSIVLLFLFIHKPSDYILYGILSVLSGVGSNLLNLWNSRNFLEFRRFNDYQFKRHLKPILTFFGLSISVSIYANMDTVMLGFLSNNRQVAFYDLSTKVKLVLAQIISALGPVVLPRVSYYLSKNDKEAFYSIIKKSLQFVLITGLPVTVYFIIMASSVINILGGAEYQSCVGCMRIIMFALLPLGIGNVACMQILAPFGLERQTMYSTICGALINLIINASLIPYYGASGAAFATVVTEFIVASIQIYYVKDIFRQVLHKASYYKIIIANILSGVILVTLKIFMQDLFPLFQLAGTFVIFVVVYFCVLFIWKEDMVYYYFNMILKKLKRM